MSLHFIHEHLISQSLYNAIKIYCKIYATLFLTKYSTVSFFRWIWIFQTFPVLFVGCSPLSFLIFSFEKRKALGRGNACRAFCNVWIKLNNINCTSMLKVYFSNTFEFSPCSSHHTESLLKTIRFSNRTIYLDKKPNTRY